MRYQVTGLPPVTQKGLSAFLPHMNRLAGSGAQQYKDGVSGYPGTRSVPLTVQGRVTGGNLALAQAGTARSSDAPETIWPNQYWALPERNYRPGLQVQVYNPVAPWLTTMVPVPAVSLRQQYLRRSAELSAGVSPGGTAATNQPVSQLLAWAQRVTGNGQPNG